MSLFTSYSFGSIEIDSICLLHAEAINTSNLTYHKCPRRKNKVTFNLKSGRFGNIDPAVIISSVSRAVED